MTDDERSKLEIYKQALTFLSAEFADLPERTAGAAAAEMLAAAIEEIETPDVRETRAETISAETVEMTAARRKVVEFLERFAKTALRIARTNFGFEDNFPMPHDKADAELLKLSKTVAANVYANQNEFILFGITHVYIESMHPKIQAFAAALAAPERPVFLVHETNVSLKKSSFATADESFEILSTFIKNHYSGQTDKLKAWNAAVKTPRAAKKTKSETNSSKA